MIDVITYLIKFSLSLTLVYAFYAILLKWLTFYTWNRLYLLFYCLACFFIPFINLDWWIKESESNSHALFLDAIPPFNEVIPANHTSGDLYSIVVILFLVGTAFCFVKLILQYTSLRRINRKAILLYQSGNIRIYSSDAAGSFTLGNSIYLDISTDHSPAEIEKVLQHEMIHVKQKHWIDLLAGELLCLVNWFNPFAWVLRASIRQNLEYIADRQVLNKGYDMKEYQYLLLKMSNIQHHGIAAHFSLTGLKNRIYMINKIKSARAHLAKFILIFPLLLLLLFAFRTVQHSPLNAIGVFTADTVAPDSAKETTVITMKDWKKNQRENERKYGKLAKPAAPPMPPVAPVPPVAPAAPKAPIPVESVQPDVNAEPPVAPVPPEAPVASVPPVPPTKTKNK
jgi:beta-lactamase regulating signal transducer with metallopeptidase domain